MLASSSNLKVKSKQNIANQWMLSKWTPEGVAKLSGIFMNIG